MRTGMVYVVWPDKGFAIFFWHGARVVVMIGLLQAGGVSSPVQGRQGYRSGLGLLGLGLGF